MTLVEFKKYMEEKRKNRYANHFTDLRKTTGEVVTCGPFTNKEWKKVKVSGKSTFNAKASKAAYNRIWR